MTRELGYTPTATQLAALNQGRKIGHTMAGEQLRGTKYRANELFHDCLDAMQELGGGSIKDFLGAVGAHDPMALAELSAKLAMKYLPAEEPPILEAERTYETAEEIA